VRHQQRRCRHYAQKTALHCCCSPAPAAAAAAVAAAAATATALACCCAAAALRTPRHRASSARPLRHTLSPARPSLTLPCSTSISNSNSRMLTSNAPQQDQTPDKHSVTSYHITATHKQCCDPRPGTSRQHAPRTANTHHIFAL
jgi:hypothetical protein